MIVIMGVAGAGKSIQGRWIADEFGLPWLSTGEFLRMMVSGERRKQMVAGKLLDDVEIIHMADKIFHLLDNDEEFILDGFPRTLTQAQWLLAQHKVGLLNISHVIHIEASEEVVMERLLARGRPDDTEESIKKRFEEYRKTTLPVIQDFENQGIAVLHVDGNKNEEQVHSQIVPAIKQYV